jgi:hypothetical protein
MFVLSATFFLFLSYKKLGGIDIETNVYYCKKLKNNGDDWLFIFIIRDIYNRTGHISDTILSWVTYLYYLLKYHSKTNTIILNRWFTSFFTTFIFCVMLMIDWSVVAVVWRHLCLSVSVSLSLSLSPYTITTQTLGEPIPYRCTTLKIDAHTYTTPSTHTQPSHTPPNTVPSSPVPRGT